MDVVSSESTNVEDWALLEGNAVCSVVIFWLYEMLGGREGRGGGGKRRGWEEREQEMNGAAWGYIWDDG